MLVKTNERTLYLYIDSDRAGRVQSIKEGDFFGESDFMEGRSKGGKSFPKYGGFPRVIQVLLLQVLSLR